MQHFRIGTAATTARVSAGIIFLIFCLVDNAVYYHVIHLHIAITGIIGKGNTQFAGSISGCGVVIHPCAYCPGLNILTTNFQANAFVSNNTTHANSDAVAVTARTGGARGRRTGR